MTTRNEAAVALRRLRQSSLDRRYSDEWVGIQFRFLDPDIDEALAAERRATVERIKHVVLNAESDSYLFDADASKGGIRMQALLAILDEVSDAAR